MPRFRFIVGLCRGLLYFKFSVRRQIFQKHACQGHRRAFTITRRSRALYDRANARRRAYVRTRVQHHNADQASHGTRIRQVGHAESNFQLLRADQGPTIHTVRALGLLTHADGRSNFDLGGVIDVARGRFWANFTKRSSGLFKGTFSVFVHRRHRFGGVSTFPFQDYPDNYRRLAGDLWRVLISCFSFILCRFVLI